MGCLRGRGGGLPTHEGMQMRRGPGRQHDLGRILLFPPLCKVKVMLQGLEAATPPTPMRGSREYARSLKPGLRVAKATWGTCVC